MTTIYGTREEFSTSSLVDKKNLRIDRQKHYIFYRSIIDKINMNDKEDCAWVFDSLVGFLQGPIWSAPLLTFIEEKSLSTYPCICCNNYIIKKKKKRKK